MTCLHFSFRKKAAAPPALDIEVDDEVSGIQNTVIYSYKELRSATEHFSPANKIGQGGFGSVFKGKLKNGTMAAIKVLSEQSRQGVREFLTEINLIADIEHPNLVKLYGCCVEGSHRILVYGYLENNSLEQTLLSRNEGKIQFSWNLRKRICIGVARGLAFLHEEIRPHIVHRDIKASNILLDKEFRPKISDFGLAKLFPEHETHISTRVAGTAGYLAPEYAIRGQLTRKADIYSYGVLLLEIVSGRNNTDKRLVAHEQYLLEKAWELYEKGELADLVDPSLNGDCNVEESCRYLKIGLCCTQSMPKLRPSMSTVVKMLMGKIDMNDRTISRPGLLFELMSGKDGSRHKNSRQSGGSSNTETRSASFETTTSHATMTFTSIDDRSY